MDRDKDDAGTAGLGLAREVGLALRAHRRELGKSQRAYAAARRVSRGVLARAEVDASGLTLGAAVSLLEGSPFTLAVVPADAERAPVDWEPTDLVARTRGGSRFPANRRVRPSGSGPLWWWYHEALGSRGGSAPTCPPWTAEGFTPPPGTVYGRRPSGGRGEPRWPY